jgi:hypothetical protein
VSLAFLDTETVTLEPGPDVVWEIGVITRDAGRPDAEWRYQLRPNMAKANPESLEVCRFAERYELADKRAQALAWSPLNGNEPAKLTHAGAALTVHALLRGRHIVGAVTNFDTERLSLWMRKAFAGVPDYRDPWHYHLVDVENLAVGFLAGQVQAHTGTAEGLQPPWSSDDLGKMCGVEPDEDEKHTALGDARWARDLYDKIMGCSA